MADFAKMTKLELVNIVTKLYGENKELNAIIDSKSSNEDKPYKAVSVIKVDGEFCAVTIKFGKHDLDEVHKYDVRPTMADYMAKTILVRDIIHVNQEIPKESKE